LLARLLLACPPRRPKEWRETDLDAATADAVSLLFERLFGLTPDVDQLGNDRPRLINLDARAREAWVAFYNAQAEEQADLSGDLAAAWSKLEGYAARLALVVHLVRGVTACQGIADLTEESIQAGVTLSRWFAAEAARVYSILSEDAERREMRLLMEWISGRPGASVTARALSRGPRRYRDNPDGAEAALAALVKAGMATWVWLDPGPTGGRPTRACRMLGGGDGTVTQDCADSAAVSSPASSGFAEEVSL